MKPPTPSVLVALERRLEPLIEMERLILRRKLLAAGFGVAALAAFLVWWQSGAFGLNRWELLLCALVGYAIIWFGSDWWAGARKVEPREMAHRLEAAHPDMQAVLLTAMDQHSDGGRLTYLQQRVVSDAVRHSMSHDWQERLFGNKAKNWDYVSSGALAVFALLVALTFPKLTGIDIMQHQDQVVVKQEEEKKTDAPVITVEVRPGDTEVEHNTRLVVDVKFTGGTPAHAVIVVSEDEEGKQERVRVNMNATVENNAFGGVVKSVERDGFYRVEYEGGVSPTYRVTTYVHPELVRSDATITPPAYSGQPAKEIKNTLNVTALEGSDIRFRMTVNKPVSVAELYGEDKSSIPLTPTKEDPLVLEGSMKPEDSQKYRLHLVDAQERSNKQPPWIKVSVLKDNPPKVDMVFPKRDLAVSPLQELPLEAKVWDDIGVEKAGAVFMLGEATTEVPLSDGKLAGKKSHDLKTMLALEKLKAEPRQLVSYYVWAEDNHPQGGVRRTMSDMFFAEVRHFEDIFREAEGGQGQGQGQGQGGVADKLAQLQKQVVNATWRLVREAGAGRKFEKMESDVGTVKEGQDTALKQTEEALEEVEDAEIRQALEDAAKAMRRASETLDGGIKKKETNPLKVALAPEREALEHLGRAQSREHRVMRAQNQQQGGGQSQQNQRQIMQLELAQKEKMYEEESEAQEEQTMEQQENLQVLNRLKELARRQEALAEKIKDLEEQMAKAKTEEEKAEIQQQLKRLQEEQEQLLRDLDELQERMEKPENQQNMAQEREKLDEAREQARQAAEQLAQQQASAAANSATRAQENLEEVRDEFRQRTAKRFSDEMRQLKQQASELEESQKQLAEAMNPEGKSAAESKPGEKGDTTAELKKNLETNQLRRQAEAQGEALDKLLENMQQLSQQAEASEPLLANSLHDAVRKAHSDGIKDALDETKINLQYSPEDAQSSERKAAQGIEELKKGVDRAAESVLGSETEALRMARNELDRLLNDVEKDEAKRQQNAGGEPGSPQQQTAQGQQGNGEQGQPGKGSESAERRMAAAGDADKEREGRQASQAGQQQGQQPQQGSRPGQGAEPGKEGMRGGLAGNTPGQEQQQRQPGQGQQPGEGQQPGQGQGEQQSQQQAQAGMQPGQGRGQGQQPGEGQSQQEQQQQAANGRQPGQGQGQQPGQGQGQDGQQPGQGQGEGMTADNTPGQGQQPSGSQGGQPSGQQQGQGQGQGQSPGGQQGMAQGGQGQGQGQGQGTQGQQPGDGQRGEGGQLAQGGNRAGGARRGNTEGSTSGGGGEGGPGGDGGWFFDGAAETDNDSTLTGSNFGDWTDRLRKVEEALEDQELRNQAAGVLENARQIRMDNRRNDMPPQSDLVQMKVLQPLAELRDRVSEELAKRESANPLAPLDRDPVPHRYRELVRRYYRELGGGQ